MSTISEYYIKIQNDLVLSIDEFLLMNVSQLLHYRKKVAIEINKCPNNEEELYKQLLEIYEYTNKKLKQLLNL